MGHRRGDGRPMTVSEPAGRGLASGALQTCRGGIGSDIEEWTFGRHALVTRIGTMVAWGWATGGVVK